MASKENQEALNEIIYSLESHMTYFGGLIKRISILQQAIDRLELVEKALDSLIEMNSKNRVVVAHCNNGKKFFKIYDEQYKEIKECEFSDLKEYLLKESEKQ